MPFDGATARRFFVDEPRAVPDELVSAVLRTAASRVRRGWCRGGFARGPFGLFQVDKLGPFALRFCAVGAIERAAFDLTESEASPLAYSNARAAAIERLARFLPAEPERTGLAADTAAVVRFNDHLAVTAAEVAAKLEEAARC